MTILQTLITKKSPDPQDSFKNELEQELELEEVPKVLNEVSDKEKSYRNLLGLKSKGLIDLKALEKNYKDRALNYSDSRLAEMNSGKRRQALDKKQRLEQAHQFLLDISKK
jgi:hypothetical protein